MSSIKKPSLDTEDGVHYPSSDGKPVGETEWHVRALMDLRTTLEAYFANRDNVKVTSALFLYYVKGDPSAREDPDSMVIKGVAKHFRRSFKTWVEKAVPCFIVEITSEQTLQEDMGNKRAVYERLGVKEYFVFDPEADCLDPPLQGFRLKGKKYVALVPAADGSLSSKELGLRLIAEGPMLRLREARTGQPVLTRLERAAAAQQRAEAAQQRADQERAEKERERQRADALEAKLARLRAAPPKRPGKKKER